MFLLLSILRRNPSLLLDLYLSGQNDISDEFGAKERDTLLKWSYLESIKFLKRYADVLEEVRTYLQTRMSTPGECSVLLEDRIGG